MRRMSMLDPSPVAPGIASSATQGTVFQNRWRVITLTGVVTFVAYLVRTDVSVAQERMVPAVGITVVLMGAITAWAFQLSYALFQIPAGILGERIGTRAALALALLGCSLASLITSAVPQRGATPVLIGTRILLGVSQAGVFPVAAMAMAIFVPVAERVRALAIIIATSSLGAATAPLLMAPVMERFGWRAVFVLSGAIALVTCAAWLALMPKDAPQPETVPGAARTQIMAGVRVLLGNAGLRRLSLAYLLHSAVYFVFVFWFFRYLTEGRGFTILASGFWGSLPGIAGMIFAPLVGAFADRLGRRIGTARARRRVAMSCLFAAGVFVLLGAVLPSAVLAICALSLSSGSINSAEAPFFSSATALGAANPGAAAGVLNLMGNLGGVISIWLVPLMSKAWGWNGTLLFWSGVCVVAALLWLTVDVRDDLRATASA